MKKTVIILGGGPEQIDAYKISRRRNLFIIGVDKNPEAIALRLCNYKIKSSIYDYKKIIRSIKIIKKIKIIGIIAIGVDCPKTVCELSEKFNLKNLDKKKYKKLGSKILLYKSLKKLDISPKFKKILKYDDIKKFILYEKYPVVIKPSADRGSRNVYLIKNNKELKKVLKKIKGKIFKENFLVQKYVNGKQYSVECLVLSKTKYLKIISSRNYKSFQFLHPNIIENGGTINPKLGYNLEKKIDNVIKEILQHFDISYGPLKLDLIFDKGKIYILEIAIRFGGGFVASRISKLITGYNFLEKYIESMKTQIKLRNKITSKTKCVVTRTVIAKEKGIIRKIKLDIPTKFRKHLLFLSFNKKIGDYVAPPESHADRICFFASVFNRRLNSEKIANKISEKIEVNLSKK